MLDLPQNSQTTIVSSRWKLNSRRRKAASRDAVSNKALPGMPMRIQMQLLLLRKIRANLVLKGKQKYRSQRKQKQP